MEELKLDLFLAPIDVEIRQYKILYLLNQYKNELQHNRLYTFFPQLIDLEVELKAILEDRNFLYKKFPQRIIGVDEEKNCLIYRPAIKDNDFYITRRLIKWALPKISSLIEEALVIYKYVYDNLIMTQVGIRVENIFEGYWLVEDPLASKLHTYKYQRGYYNQNNKLVPTVNFKYLSTYSLQPTKTAISFITEEFIKIFLGIHTHSTIITESNIPFPYQETIMPIAKQKFVVTLLSPWPP